MLVWMKWLWGQGKGVGRGVGGFMRVIDGSFLKGQALTIFAFLFHYLELRFMSMPKSM